MTKKILLLTPIFACILCTSCRQKKAVETTQQTVADTVHKFKLPEVPAMYTTPEQRGEYVALHYWDNFNFADTTYIHLPDVAEQAFVDFISVLSHTSETTATEAIKHFMTSAQGNKKVYTYFTNMADHYLYDPNSPFRNETLYIAVLQSMLASPTLEEAEKIQPRFRLNLALKNRPGEKALNFAYTLESGKEATLYGLHSPYTILFFNNPGCHACAETIGMLKQSRIVNELLARKEVEILSIYPDEDTDEWTEHLNDFPSDWICGYDKNAVIREKDLYDLRAIPTLYLLDKEKRVLVKDAPFQTIERYLVQIIQGMATK